MYEVLITGAGKIGITIACQLASSGDYKVHLADNQIANFNKNALGNVKDQINLVKLDVSNALEFAEFIKSSNVQAIISSLPFFLNPEVASIAREFNLHYFDLTEDTKVTDKVKQLAEGADSAFVPQCGLAPGFISIAANDLMQQFDTVESVLMRVGALPTNPNNALKYSLTWSTEGLINEYANPCFAIQDSKKTELAPLADLETIKVDGLKYEAFNTSGGLGSMADTHFGKVANMNYKTMRYPGHCEQMQLLMNDLKLRDKQELLKEILENAVPRTKKDVVIVYVSTTGYINGQLYEDNYVKKIYPQQIANSEFSAIQITTSSGICAVVDTVFGNANEYKGFVTQEQFSLGQFLSNRFGKHYA